jgi:hypothetical protein
MSNKRRVPAYRAVGTTPDFTAGGRRREKPGGQNNGTVHDFGAGRRRGVHFTTDIKASFCASARR